VKPSRCIGGSRLTSVVAALAAVAAVWLAIGSAGAAAASGQTPSALLAIAACPVKTNQAKPGPALRPPIDLSPTTQSAQKLVNFGTSRGVKVIRHVTFTAAKPLPASVTAEQISFEASLARTGDTLETAEFPEPTFTVPVISEDRQSISFSICLNAAGIAAGKYVGLVSVSGPPGLGAASINLTVNAKDAQLFTFGWIVALLGAFGLLLIKDAAAAKTGANNWGAALSQPLTNLAWWGATVVALATAFGALYGAYSADPAWGATGFAGIVSLVGTAFGAIGGHAILTAFGTKA